jgi:sugar phosphate isomerase/epimerase
MTVSPAPPTSTPRLLCSTGAISRGPDATNEARVERYGAHIAADGLEVMIYDSWYGELDEIARRFRRLGLAMPVTHGEKSIGPDLVASDPAIRHRAFARFEDNCRFTAAIGADRIVLHLWGLPDSDTLIERQLDDLAALLDRADEHGLMLAVEAIPCVVSDPLSVVRRVLERDGRARVAIDTEFLAMHGQLDAVFAADWLWAAGAVVHVHIKDYNGTLVDETGRRRYLHPGEGAIAFDTWFGQLAAKGYRAAISLESPVVGPQGEVSIDRANASVAWLRSRIATAWAGA